MRTFGIFNLTRKPLEVKSDAFHLLYATHFYASISTSKSPVAIDSPATA